ncbi:hypothetical protein HanXRQr2_Chr15g0714651 [Helianthus annuus]|uniref:Uncharacterized protein n=1 Tax=Helianthus annuus TaxID=4232 RepID=A0A9K3H3S7_HELAN|nr:hypothetical protein HanXRQr2_Chr15g0714651 [Helianthus annuus]KAJ0833058.1 hypothetical protein HanPSC8_Chr15g0685871 [Helianthus annuus]
MRRRRCDGTQRRRLSFLFRFQEEFGDEDEHDGEMKKIMMMIMSAAGRRRSHAGGDGNGGDYI